MINYKYFGTDGIRGCVGNQPITPDFILKLGWAAGKVLADHGSRKIIVGKDTRISGYMLESALGAGLSAAGISILFTGFIPTPAVAYLTRSFSAEAGIVISASHNPFYYNGIKFFSNNGTKLTNKIEKAIEVEIKKGVTCIDSTYILGKSNHIIDAAGRYIEFCKSTFPREINLNGFKIVIDCANGATYHIAPNVFQELGAKVIKIGCEPNGFNINKEVGTTDIRLLQKHVLEEKADLGIAFDGDGDRVIMVDQKGNKLDGDQIIYIIVRENLRLGKLRGGAVGTVMSNIGLELAFKKLGIPFVRSKVGDRYVLEKLKEKSWNIGAENSGHIILLDKNTTSDGIIASLQVVAAMVRNNTILSELYNDIKIYPQVVVNVSLTNNNIDRLKSERLMTVISEVKSSLGNDGRIILRKSGTEPLIRIMIEGRDEVKVNNFANLIANIIK